MASGAADRRQIRAAPAVLEHRGLSPRLLPPQRRVHRELASPPIPDELLLDIFLRLPVAADLVRASAACVSFRRLIADRSFLRQYRKIHAPPLLGFLDFSAEPLHPSSSAASAVALAADFSFSFLPAPSSDWDIEDICDGRVLLVRRDFAEMMVCDPLHRRHLLLPPIPEFNEWVRSGSADKPRGFGLQILLVGGDEEASEETFFRVIYATFGEHKEAVFVFSSSTGQWRATPSTVRLDFYGWLQYAYGCLYQVIDCTDKLKVLNTRSMEFSLMDLPSEVRASHVNIAIVEAGEGIVGMFVLPHETSVLCYFVRPNKGGSSSQWQLEKTISLDSSQYSFPESSTLRKLYLHHPGSPSSEAGLFSMDVKTFQLERAFGSNYNMLYPLPYNNFPPFLSTPTVGVGNGAEKETLEQGCAAGSSTESPQSE